MHLQKLKDTSMLSAHMFANTPQRAHSDAFRAILPAVLPAAGGLRWAGLSGPVCCRGLPATPATIPPPAAAASRVHRLPPQPTSTRHTSPRPRTAERLCTGGGAARGVWPAGGLRSGGVRPTSICAAGVWSADWDAGWCHPPTCGCACWAAGVQPAGGTGGCGAAVRPTIWAAGKSGSQGEADLLLDDASPG